MEKILVTGGAGYIGSHIVKRLCDLGYDVIVLDNLSRGNEWAIDKRAVFYNIDIARIKEYRLKNLLKKNKPKATIHLAAFAYVGESIKKPHMYYSNNCVGTLNLVNALEERNRKKIVFSSTCATYGKPEYIPIDESHPTKPINPYGSSKLMCEQYIKDMGFDYFIFRYFNVCGGDKEYEIGEYHIPEPHVIPILIDCALNNKEFTISGEDFPTNDGTCIRDYINVLDLVDAHVIALEKLLNNDDKQKTINLGTAKGYSVKDLLKIVEECTGKNIKYKIGPRREGDPSKLVANYSYAKKVLNWKPQIGIEESIRDMVEWYYLKKLRAEKS